MSNSFLIKAIMEKIERDKNNLNNKLVKVLDKDDWYNLGKRDYAEGLLDYLEVVLDFIKDE